MSLPSHKHSSHNREDIRKSDECGCFCCCKQFDPDEIKEWIDNGSTALCPFCGVDSVLGNVTGIKISQDLLIDMYKKWFIV